MIKIEIRHSILALKMDKGSIQNTTKFKIDNLLGLGEKYDQFTTYYLSNCYTIWCVLHWKLDTAVFWFVYSWKCNRSNNYVYFTNYRYRKSTLHSRWLKLYGKAFSVVFYSDDSRSH